VQWIKLPAKQAREPERILSLGIGQNNTFLPHRGKPARAVESGEGDSTPMDALGTVGIAFHGDAHHHRAVLLDLSNFAQSHVVAKPGHQCGLKIEGAEVAGGEARDQEKDHQAKRQNA